MGEPSNGVQRTIGRLEGQINGLSETVEKISNDMGVLTEKVDDLAVSISRITGERRIERRIIGMIGGGCGAALTEIARLIITRHG